MEFFPSKKSNNRGSLFSCPCAVLGFDFAILLPTAWPYFGSAWLSLAQLGSAWLSLAQLGDVHRPLDWSLLSIYHRANQIVFYFEWSL